MFASSAAPHRIGFSRADGRRAHGRSALSDLAHCTQPAVHPRLQCPFAALLLRVRRPGTDRYPPFRPRMCQTTRPILTVTAATGCPGAALTKRWLLAIPQRRSLAVRAAEPGRDHNLLCASFGTPAQRQPRFEDPPPRSEGIIVMGNGSGMVGMWWFWLFGLLVVLGIALVVVVLVRVLGGGIVGAAPPVWAARHRCRVRRAGSSISGTPAVS